MLTKQLMRADQPIKIELQIRLDGVVDGFVSCRVVLFFFTKSQSYENAKAIGIHGENEVGSSV